MTGKKLKFEQLKEITENTGNASSKIRIISIVLALLGLLLVRQVLPLGLNHPDLYLM